MKSKYFKRFGVQYLLFVENKSQTVQVKFEFIDLRLRREKHDEIRQAIDKCPEKFELILPDCTLCFNCPMIRVEHEYIPIRSEEHEKQFLEVVDSE